MVNGLRNKGIDIVPIKELMSGSSDETVLETANEQGRILITFDSDFGQLIFRQKLEARGVILLKFAPKSTQQVVDVTLNVLKTQAKIEGNFFIATAQIHLIKPRIYFPFPGLIVSANHAAIQNTRTVGAV